MTQTTQESNEEAVERLLVSEILHSNENLICSIGICTAFSDGIVNQLKKTEDARDIIKLVADCVARYKVVCSFFAKTAVPAMLNP